MKKISLIIIVLMISLMTKSQTVDTAFHYNTAVKVVGFKANFYDSINVDHFSILIFDDDLKTSCNVKWILYDSLGAVHVQGAFSITGATYTAWNHGFLGIYTVVGNKLKLTYQ